jgi:hypothetical protein
MVCEGSFRRKTERQKTCTDVRCKAELRRFPLAYSWPEKHEEGKPPSDTSKAPGSAHFTGLKTGIRPTHKCLREWVWSPETDLELELHDGKGNLLARLEHNGGRYRRDAPLSRGG